MVTACRCATPLLAGGLGGIPAVAVRNLPACPPARPPACLPVYPACLCILLVRCRVYDLRRVGDNPSAPTAEPVSL